MRRTNYVWLVLKALVVSPLVVFVVFLREDGPLGLPFELDTLVVNTVPLQKWANVPFLLARPQKVLLRRLGALKGNRPLPARPTRVLAKGGSSSPTPPLTGTLPPRLLPHIKHMGVARPRTHTYHDKTETGKPLSMEGPRKQ